MIIAQQKRKENIAEYLLYMWQVEDIIRAFNLDIELLKQHVISHFSTDESTLSAITKWYEDLINMMLLEGKKEQGHLQINENTLADLENLNREMIADRTEVAYQSAFFAATQDILHFSQKSKISEDLPITLAFNMLYGVLTLRLKKQPVSEETNQSILRVQKVISLLAHRFHNPKKENE